MDAKTSKVHQAIDQAWNRFVAKLPPDLARIAEDLPHRFALTPHPGTPWSRVFNNAAVLGFPALLLDGQPAPDAVRADAVAAHLYAIVGAFGRDRIDDGQITLGIEEHALVERVGRARDQTMAPLEAKAPGCEFTFAWAERMTAESVRDERAVFSGRMPATREGYRAVSWKKQGLAFPAALMAAAAAGWSEEAQRHVEALVAGAALGLQYRDDVVDWMDDQSAGASWPVLLLEHAPEDASLEAIARALAAEGALVRLLEMSRDAFLAAAVAAEALGASALAMWAHGQSTATADLAVREAANPGFAVKWETERRARREQQQAQLAAAEATKRAA